MQDKKRTYTRPEHTFNMQQKSKQKMKTNTESAYGSFQPPHFSHEMYVDEIAVQK